MRKEFLRSAGMLAGGTAISQALVLMLTPVLTRLYDPADFGVLALFMSVIAIGIVPATFRYEQAIPIPEEDHEAIYLLILSGAILLGSGGILAVAVWGLGGILATMGGASSLLPYRWLLIPAFIGAGVYQLLNLWGVRRKAFGLIAKTRVMKSASMLGTQVGLGALGVGGGGLIAGEVVNRLMGVGALGALVFGQVRSALGTFSWSRLVAIAIQYRRFPMLAAPAAVLNTIGFHLPVMLLAFWFGEVVVGWFALSLRVIQLPISMVAQAVAQVFFAEAGEHCRSGELGRRVEEIAELLIRIGVGPALLVVIAGGELFAWIFGPEWAEAGTFSQWIMPWLLLTLITSPLSTVVFVLEKQRGELAFQVALLVGRVWALGVGYALGSSHMAIVLFSLVSAATWLGYLFWLLKVTQATGGVLVQRFGVELLYAAAFMVPLGVTIWLGAGTVYFVTAAGIGLMVALARSVLHCCQVLRIESQ